VKPTRAMLAAALVFRAVASADDPILMIDTGGHTAPVRAVLFTGDSRYLVSAGDDKVVRVWDAATGQPVRSIRGQIGAGTEGMIYAAAYSHNGRYLAVAGQLPGNGIRIHDFASGEVVAVLKGHSSTIECLAFSLDDTYLASGDSAGIVRTWAVRSMSSLRELRGHTGRVHTVAFSTDGSRLVSGSFDTSLRLWNVSNGALIRQITGHQKIVVSAAFSSDGRTLASVSEDGTLRFWDGATGNPIGVIEDAGPRPANLSFAPDGRRVLTASSDGHPLAKVYSLAARAVTASFREHDETITATAISPDGRMAATAGGSGNEIYLWDVNSGASIRKLAGKGTSVWSAAFAADERSILFGHKKSANAHPNDYGPLDSRFWLIKQDDDFRVRWGGAVKPDGTEVAAAEENGRQTVAIARGPSGDAAAALQVMREGQIVKQFVRDQTSGYRHLSYTFTPDGRVISGGLNGVLLLYSNPGRRPLAFIGHTGAVLAVAVSPDGRTLISGSDDQTVKLWDVETQRNLLSVFVAADQQWVAWTAEGYYASSLYGEKYVGWHANRGEQKAANYYTVARFRKEFDRPDIIAQQLKLHDIDRAVRIANKNVGMPERPPAAPAEVATMLPPDIRFITPDEENMVVQNAAYTLKALAFSTTLPIREVSVLLNGRPAGAIHANAQSQDVRLDVRLDRGLNTLTVKAANSRGVEGQQTRKIQCACAVQDTRKPNLIFLGIGISMYKVREISLQFADRDAAQMRDVFLRQKNSRLFGDVQAELLTNDGATREAIINKLEWFKRAGASGDVRVLFVAGHGERSGVRNEYFLCANGHTPKDSPELNDVRWSILMDALTAVPGKAVLLLDTCHAGAVSGPQTRGVTPVDIDSVVADFKGVSGVVVFAAATGIESSYENDQWKHGAFTESIIEGLSGKVAGDNGVIKTSDLGLWVTKQVPTMTNNNQHPVVYYIPEGELLPFPIFAVK
jgi:WD40 repeat protein